VGYRKFDIEDINKLTPGIDWKILLHGLNVPDQDSVVVDVPGFFTDVAHYLKEKRLTTWKRYLQYNLVSHMAPYLSRAFDSCSFSFYHRALQGQQEQGPRWEKVMAAIDHSEGDLLGQMYVARYVKPGTKERMEQLVDNLQQVYADRISKMHWLSDTTKQKALVKLRAITKKIGYPDEWTDYSTLTIVNKSYAKNIMIAEQWAFQNEMNKLTKPVNRAM
jgi:putative endopeptidase